MCPASTCVHQIQYKRTNNKLAIINKNVNDNIFNNKT